MTVQQWVLIAKSPGELQSELLRGLLEAQGIPVRLVFEGAGRAYGIMVGPLGEVEIMVPESNAQDAKNVLARYEAGEFEEPEGENF